MIDIVELLENIPEGEECVITFTNGNEFGLQDFEGVDSSIYGRDDLVVAEVVTQMNCDRRYSKPGTSLEFSFRDIATVNGIDIEHWVKEQGK